MDWKSVVGTVAPAIATSLGGPLAGAAVGALAKALGVDAKEAAVAKAVVSASPEVLAAMRRADQEFQVRMAELGLDPEKIAAADRASARERQAKTGDTTPQTLAYVYTAGFFAVLAAQFVLGYLGVVLPDQVLRTLDITTGVLFAFVMASKDFFLGSSKSSQDKDAHIRHMWDSTP
jgi:hypothetical protein